MGLPLWLPKGAELRKRLEDFLTRAQKEAGYEMVISPHIGNKKLYETSGHFQKYGESSFMPIKSPSSDEEFLLKPMNCPHHCEIYKSEQWSYRDLPKRYAEFGTVYRYEQSGELHGLTRVRGFTQDDAHIFCTKDQINEEVKTLLNFSVKLLNSFGLSEIEADLSTKPDKSIGSDDDWDMATESLKKSLTELDIPFATAEGEGAFYGPKIDLHVKDAIGRRWQLSTIQVDFAQPDNFDIEYVDNNNKKIRPVMIHRALLGSIERFTGVLLEHYAGHMPGWLSPVQIDILTIGNVSSYVAEIKEHLKDFRINIDDRNVRLGEKIHNSQKIKVPIQLIVGEKDVSNKTFAINFYNADDKKDIEFEKGIKEINNYLKTPEFDLNG